MKCPRFFTPLPNFIPFLQRETKKNRRPIMDCGCGEGHLLRELREAKLPAVGIDPRFEQMNYSPASDLIAIIMGSEAENCSIIRNFPTLILTCRPCHNQFPVRVNEVRHHGSTQYYVGLDHNLEMDLMGCKTRLALKAPVGEEGEMIWEVLK